MQFSFIKRLNPIYFTLFFLGIRWGELGPIKFSKIFTVVEMIEMGEMIVVLAADMIYMVDGHFHLFSSVLK